MFLSQFYNFLWQQISIILPISFAKSPSSKLAIKERIWVQGHWFPSRFPVWWVAQLCNQITNPGHIGAYRRIEEHQHLGGKSQSPHTTTHIKRCSGNFKRFLLNTNLHSEIVPRPSHPIPYCVNFLSDHIFLGCLNLLQSFASIITFLVSFYQLCSGKQNVFMLLSNFEKEKGKVQVLLE